MGHEQYSDLNPHLEIAKLSRIYASEIAIRLNDLLYCVPEFDRYSRLLGQT
jgi:hypothetical protein